MPPEPVPQQDHQDYRDEINNSLASTSAAQSVLMGTLQLRGLTGAIPPQAFMPFYQSFNHLFNLTSRLKIMREQEGALIAKIDGWLEPTNKIDALRVRSGSELFREWSWKLEYHGIHTFTK